MILVVACVVGLLVLAESQEDLSKHQEFLSKYVHVGSDASRTPLGHYDKFITPNFKHMQQSSGPDALSYHKSPAEDGPAADETQYLDVTGGYGGKAKDSMDVIAAREEEERVVQKLFGNGNTNNTPITLSAIGIGFLALVTMLGARLRRGQSVSIPTSSGTLGSDMSVSLAPGVGDNIMEMSSQGEMRHPYKDTSRRVAWRQLSSQSSHALTLCHAKHPDDGDPLDKLESIAAAWKDGGWFKVQGELFPELDQGPGFEDVGKPIEVKVDETNWAGEAPKTIEVYLEETSQADEAATAVEVQTGETSGAIARSRDAYLGPTSDGAKSLTLPSSSDSTKELAVAGDFSQFLQRPEIVNRYQRTDSGAIVFRNEAALSATVAAFATELTRELGAAARALARYVDELESELASADEGAVLLRSQLAEAESSVEEKVSVAEAEAARAKEAREAAAAAEAAKKKAEADAEEAECAAEENAAKLAQVEAQTNVSEQDVQAARAAAVEIEKKLLAAERRAATAADESQSVARRAAAAERQAASAAGAQEATEAVLDAMKRRAEAAEESANAAAQATSEALRRAEESEKTLKKQLAQIADNIDDPDVADVVADATRLVSEVAAKSSGKKPALSRMRKAELIEECQQMGLEFEGLRVPELRVLLRGQRSKVKDKVKA
jgi:hypothetical protein